MFGFQCFPLRLQALLVVALGREGAFVLVLFEMAVQLFNPVGPSLSQP
jgi:hypothetical protein